MLDLPSDCVVWKSLNKQGGGGEEKQKNFIAAAQRAEKSLTSEASLLFFSSRFSLASAAGGMRGIFIARRLTGKSVSQLFVAVRAKAAAVRRRRAAEPLSR